MGITIKTPIPQLLSSLVKPVRGHEKEAIYAATITIGLIILTLGFLYYLLPPRVVRPPEWWTPFHLHPFISIAVALFCTGPAVASILESRRQKAIDDALPRLLRDIAEAQETGLTLIRALEESAKKAYGPITGELRKLVVQLSWGASFETAFEAFAKRIGTELADRTTILISEATKFGGDLKATFINTSNFVACLLYTLTLPTSDLV